jgi:antitoxin (DNA-binding transcriptional repressor) of toxin-antitoxin stability system
MVWLRYYIAGLREERFDWVSIEVYLELNMKAALETINTKQLRTGLGRIIERARRGASFLVLHRSRPAFQIVPADVGAIQLPPLQNDPLYRAEAVGRSKDGLRAAEHDRVLYGR